MSTKENALVHEVFGDAMLVPNGTNSYAVYQKRGFAKAKKAYTIDGEEVTEAHRFPNYAFVLFRTDAGDYLRGANNEALTADSRWADFYYEPYTASLFRKDARGSWYDLEGFALSAPILLRGDVLISLPGKTSRKSLAFTGQQVIVSPHARLIQLGKMVYDQALAPVYYFGQRLTGLGPKHISFGGEDQWQEVRLGVKDYAFINEFTAVPLLVNDEEIVAHDASVTRGSHHFEVFRSATRSYALENHSGGDLRYEGVSLAADLTTYHQLKEAEIVQVDDGEKTFYFDLNKQQPFRISELGRELLIAIDYAPVKVSGNKLYSMRTEQRTFVYDATAEQIFTLNGGNYQPVAVRPVPGFEGAWFMALIDDRWQLCDMERAAVYTFGEEGLTVGEVLGKPADKLVNAKTSGGSPVTLDVRRGASQVTVGHIAGRIIEAITGKPTRVGALLLQHVQMASLGGSVLRVVDLDALELRAFGLPDDLKQYPDQPQPSAFAGNPFTKIVFDQQVVIQGESFYRASFLTYAGDERPTLLQTVNARPLHLDGVGHRNELVTGFNVGTITEGHRLGQHVMVSVSTLTEDLKPSELLYSLHTNKSWLPFYDDFLPVFRRAIPLLGEGKLPVMLFESLEHTGTGEYVAVEKDPPYRLLAERKKGKVVPKIVTTKSRALIDPAEVSGLVDLFVNRGMLVEVS